MTKIIVQYRDVDTTIYAVDENLILSWYGDTPAAKRLTSIYRQPYQDVHQVLDEMTWLSQLLLITQISTVSPSLGWNVLKYKAMIALSPALLGLMIFMTVLWIVNVIAGLG